MEHRFSTGSNALLATWISRDISKYLKKEAITVIQIG